MKKLLSIEGTITVNLHYPIFTAFQTAAPITFSRLRDESRLNGFITPLIANKGVIKSNILKYLP